MVRPIPPTPKRLLATHDAGVVHAALRINEDGSVTDVAILSKIPDDMVDESLLKYFRRIVFSSVRDGRVRIPYETELVLVYRPFEEKKG